ncbi:MAG TPA: FAD-dependent oxidoreductase [Solirubrobacteraceae bacterium]|nr:FAD-dependent oxidoreductase [Solirubrobacteraceae bacterium]
MQDSYDVVVLGSGAAGCTAALTAAVEGASVALLEKGDGFGGTTAMSGAIVWIPANPIAARHGVVDTPEDALAYLGSLSHGLIDPELAETLVRTGPEMLEYLAARTPVHFRLVERFPDYHPEHPGGLPDGGRSLEPELFSFDELGEWGERIAPEVTIRRLRLCEQTHGGGTGVIQDETLHEREAADIRSCGLALIGALIRGCLDNGVDAETGVCGRELIVADGRVTGVEVEIGGERRAIGARSGVVLATGGFEWNPELVRAFLRGPMTAPASTPTNTGDGLRMAMRVGASLGNMREAWWMPCFQIPGDTYLGQPRSVLTLRERTVPGSIMVNRRGVRFTNEAANYNAQGAALHAFDMTAFEYANIPAWIVFDARCFESYGFSSVAPGDDPPNWFARGETVAELGAEVGVPADALTATVDRFNANVAATGRDPEFGRGDSAYDYWNGDQTRPGHAATLGTLERPPYYAVQLHSGTLGTKGGPRTDRDGRVLDLDGAVIEGLYAAGNAMAGVTGMVYGGAGGTIGPAMTFAFRAGRHAAHARASVEAAAR